MELIIFFVFLVLISAIAFGTQLASYAAYQRKPAMTLPPVHAGMAAHHS